jgi:lysophospholipase L1-like esterase
MSETRFGYSQRVHSLSADQEPFDERAGENLTDGTDVPGSRRGALVVVTGLLAVLALTIASTPTAVIRGRRVLVIGDSIMLQSHDDVQSALTAAGWQPTVYAKGGTNVAYWIRPAATLVARLHPDVVVVELGTNDCGDCAGVGWDVDRVMASFADAGLVAWLNVQQDAPYPPQPDAINLTLASALAWWDNTKIVDFNRAFAGHPEWHAGTPSGVHLSPDGEHALAQLIVAALPPARPGASPRPARAGG